MSLALVTPPAAEPITLSDAKAFAQIETDADDTLVNQLIKAARERIEAETHRQIVTATWDYSFDTFPSGDSFALKLPPLQSVTSLKYIDTDGVQQTWDASNYSVDTATTPGRIIRAYSVTSWPTIRSQKNAVTVRFVAGWLDDATHPMPETVRTCIRSLIKLWYDNPNPVVTSGAQPKIIPMWIRDMIDMNMVGEDYI